MTDALIRVRVECHAGYRGEETPIRIFFDERGIEVAEVMDQWLAPDHRYFKIKGDDAATYILRHDVTTGVWELVMVERAGTGTREMMR